MGDITAAKKILHDMCMESYADGMRDGFDSAVKGLDAGALMLSSDDAAYPGLLLAITLLKQIQQEKSNKKEN